MFQSVSIGDKFIKHIRESSPFRAQWGEIITIVDKRINQHGTVYVKYRSERNGFELGESLSFMIDVLHYEPYDNQDKQSL